MPFVEEAQRLGEAAISPEHLLVAIVREGEGIAAKMLQVSVQIEWVRDRLRFSKAPEAEVEPVTPPTDFQTALEQHPAAQTVFEKLSPAKKKRFVDSIERAEGEDARSQQVKVAIEQLQKIARFLPQ